MDKVLVTRHLKDIHDYIALPQDAINEVLALVDVIASDYDFEKKLKGIEAYSIAVKNENPALIDKLAEEKGVDKNLLRLTAIELFTIGMKERYLAKGWGMDVYYDSLLDITIWAKVCFARTGRWGLLEYSWLFVQIIGRVVRLGRLQFERFPVQPHDNGRVVGGVVLYEDMPVINIHIPEGEPITAEKRLDSYRRAYRFFNQSGYAIFHCHSWLLYEKHYDFLPAKSNVISFMNDFELVHNDTSVGNSDLWRLFGTAWPAKDNDYSLLPQKTGMQKAYVSYLLNGGTGGCSKGFFAFDGEKIIK